MKAIVTVKDGPFRTLIVEMTTSQLGTPISDVAKIAEAATDQALRLWPRATAAVVEVAS